MYDGTKGLKSYRCNDKYYFFFNGTNNQVITLQRMLSKELDIAILGAGIGGLSTAIALHQTGFKNLHIYERTHTPHTIGAGLVLWPNATAILSRLGLEETVKKFGGSLNSMKRLTSSGEYLNELSIIEINHRMKYESYAIARADLEKILRQTVQELQIPISYSKNAINITKQNSGCRLNFSDGSSRTSEIIIGADGRMNSIARQYIVGDNQPIYQNYVNWVGLLRNQPITANRNKNILDFWGQGERFGYVPIDDNTAYWAGCKKLPAGMGEPPLGNKTTLHKIFEGWPDPITEIIECTPEQQIRRIEVYDLDPTQTWHRDHVCLLGDAAHAALPTSGQGACLAIEDAWHLSKCLHESTSLEEAFERFQTLRFKKTTSITIGARHFADNLFNENLDFCLQRNEQAKNADVSAQIDGMSQLWSS